MEEVILSSIKADDLVERVANKLAQLIPYSAKPEPIEIINVKELCGRLNISRTTCIKYTKNRKIPSLKIGGSVKYNWASVVKALEKRS